MTLQDDNSRLGDFPPPAWLGFRFAPKHGSHSSCQQTVHLALPHSPTTASPSRKSSLDAVLPRGGPGGPAGGRGASHL